MTTYPIVSASYLDPVPRRRGVLSGKRRDGKEIAPLGAHQVRVYRVDGQYIVDEGDLPLDHDQVVRASHVSVVDMGVGVAVTVEMPIPSAEASDFTVRVTFACTVTDAARMVRDNVAAQTAIVAYLGRDPKLGHSGQQYRMAQINEVRRQISARVRAYTDVKPPEVPGLRIVLTGVEVLTPEELAAFEKARREALKAHVLEAEKQGYSQDLQIGKERHSQRLAESQRLAQHAAEEEAQRHTHTVAERDQAHQHMLRAEADEFARRVVERAVESIGGDPFRALVWAQKMGEINAKELAERINEDRVRELEWERGRDQQEREGRLRREQQEREDRVRELEQERQDRRRRDQQEREDHIRELEQERADRLRQEEQEREDRNRQLDMKLDLVRTLAARGHLDFVNVRLEGLVQDLAGMPPSALDGGAADGTGALPAGQERVPIEAPRDGDGPDRSTDAIEVDAEVREEDD